MFKTFHIFIFSLCTSSFPKLPTIPVLYVCLIYKIQSSLLYFHGTENPLIESIATAVHITVTRLLFTSTSTQDYLSLHFLRQKYGGSLGSDDDLAWFGCEVTLSHHEESHHAPCSETKHMHYQQTYGAIRRLNFTYSYAMYLWLVN